MLKCAINLASLGNSWPVPPFEGNGLFNRFMLMKFTSLSSFCVLMAVLASAPPSASAAGQLTVQVGTPAAPATPLVNHGDTWKLRKGTNEPVATWMTDSDAALDATWVSAPGGFGYGDPGIVGEATTLSDMLNNYTTIYIRKSFNVASAVGTNTHLQL